MSRQGARPTRQHGRARAWYRGDCHVHSALSSGAALTLQQLSAEARLAGLDFVALTEHDSADTHAAWAGLGDDELLTICGQEVTTPTGHWLALGPSIGQVVHGRPQPGLTQVHEAGGLCVVAHPRAPYASGTFTLPLAGFDLVEVWNGPWTSDLLWQADNEAALADWAGNLPDAVRGARWCPAIGSSDAHLAGQMGVPHTVVRAEERTQQAVLDGLRAGRSWIAESPAVDLAFLAVAGDRRAGIGERMEARDDRVVCRAEVGGVPSGRIDVHTDTGRVHRVSLPTEGAGTLEWWMGPREAAFVRLEVRHADGRMAALTNPILLV